MTLGELHPRCNLILGGFHPCHILHLGELRPLIQKTPRGDWQYSLPKIWFYFEFVDKFVDIINLYNI